MENETTEKNIERLIHYIAQQKKAHKTIPHTVSIFNAQLPTRSVHTTLPCFTTHLHTKETKNVSNAHDDHIP